ncbi:hypothetical protein [Oceanobacillus sp. 1P07AA]|uniref:hypothetical protein n=1 Tax=Oceanobacillus sp. 1P07AA TaxID=3132293 RepID=UPI0039A4EC39
MKHHIRAFAVGLFTSALIILIVFFLVQDSQTPIEDVKAEELIPVLEDQGYAILSQEEYISYSVNGNDSDNKSATNHESEDEDTVESKEETENNKEDEEENSEEESEQDSAVEYKLTVETGMASSEISDILENEDIIESASDFNNYLEDNDYAINVKPGTFELSSDMSHFDIAEVITSYN